MITIDDFKKVEIKAGKIISAEPVEGSEKLLRLSVDFGPAPETGNEEKRDVRQVMSGIAKFVPPDELAGTTCAFVTNLEPREIMGQRSEAMILAFSGELPGGEKGFFSLLKVPGDVPPGSPVR